MSESINTMATVENLKTSNKGFELTCEYKNFPVSFVNSLRRIVLGEIPTVIITDVQILENTSQLPHHMLKHRVEMLPVNVSPDDSSTIRDAKIELRVFPDPKADKVRTITTDDFVVESNRGKILARDRDFDTPILFLRLRPDEGVHLKARLAVTRGDACQVSHTTTLWHVDPERMKEDRKRWVEEEKKDPIDFDNFYYQKSYSRDENGRPNWIDMQIESVGILPAKDILKYAVKILRKNVDDFIKEAVEKIQRLSEENAFKIEMANSGHTIGALIQQVMYSDMNVDYVGYDIPHPLKNDLVILFTTKKTPESILRTAKDTIMEYCSIVEKAL